MTRRILVLGATGRVGSLVVQALAAAGHAVAGLARDPARAAAGWPAGVGAVAGDLAAPASYADALQGLDALLVATPIHPRMARWQCDAIEAAAAAAVPRIVKLSGSHWTLEPGRETTVGAAHAEAEAALAQAARRHGLRHACIRPNAFLQGMLARLPAELRAGDAFSLPIGDAAVSFTDVRDIAAACAHALTTDGELPARVEISGPVALGGQELAARASALLGRPVAYRRVATADAVARARAAGTDAFTLQHLGEVLALLQAGAGSAVLPGFERFTGRPARAPDGYLAEALQ